MELTPEQKEDREVATVMRWARALIGNGAHRDRILDELEKVIAELRAEKS